MPNFAPPAVSLRQLQYLVAVADAHTFRRAAEQCRVSQPSLSAQIAELESSLNVQVFERTKKGVLVTVAGEELLKRARKVLAEVEALEAAALRFIDPLAGQLRVGVIPTIGPYLLPEIVPILRKAYPKLSVRWVEEKTEVLVKLIQQGELDAAVLAQHASLGDLKSTELIEDKFVVATPKTHKLARGAGPVSPRTLEDEHFLLLDDGHCFRDQALTYCAQSGLQEMGFRATSLPTLVQMVASGAGVTLVPEVAVPVETHRADVAIRRLAAPEPSRHIVLAWRPGSPATEALGEVGQTIKDSLVRAHQAVTLADPTAGRSSPAARGA